MAGPSAGGQGREHPVDEVGVVVVDVEARPRRRRWRRGSRPASPRRSRRRGRVSTRTTGSAVAKARASASVVSLEPFSTTSTSKVRSRSRSSPTSSFSVWSRSPASLWAGITTDTPGAASRAGTVGGMTVGYRPFHGRPHAARARERRQGRGDRRRVGGRPAVGDHVRRARGARQPPRPRVPRARARPRRAHRVVRPELARGDRHHPRQPQGRAHVGPASRTDSTPPRCST